MAGVTMRQGRGLNRSSKLRGRNDNDEGVRLDFSKDPSENIREILSNIVKQHNVSKSRKLAFLNAFVHMLHKNQHKPLGISYYKILCCLRVCVLHEAKEVRAASLRVMRYLMNDECIDALLALHIDYLIARSLDICLDNEIERVHALRLVRKIISVNPHKMPPSLVYPLVAISNDGSYERDRLLNICLSTICELALLSPGTLVQCGGVATILHNIIDSYLYPRINECLVSSLLYLLNHPSTRGHISLSTDLEHLLAPFTDCHYRYSPIDSDVQPLDEKENRYTASRSALVTILRSWPGLICMCRPDSRGLQSLLSTLYLRDHTMRKAVLDIVYDVFQLPRPAWVADFTAGLYSVDPTRMKEDWKLTNGFVVSEGRALLPHLSQTRPNLVDNHMALVLSSWITAGLFEALVEVVTSCDSELFVYSVILLGQLLHKASHLLPDEIGYSCHTLPSLMALVSADDTPISTRRRVGTVVGCLSRIHTLKKRGLALCSLYLSQITRYYPHSYSLMTATHPRDSPSRRLDRFCYPKSLTDESMIQTIQDSNVINTDVFTSWNWHLISAILQWSHDVLVQMQDQTALRFIRRLVHFFRPSSQQYASVDESHDLSEVYTTTGCHLIDFLHRAQGSGRKQLTTLFADISHIIAEVTVPYPAYETQLGITNVTSTKLVAHYFILIGHISALSTGQEVLQQTGIFKQLLELVSITSHDVYMKLAIACLDYSRSGMAPVILSKAINSGSETSRLYATKFLHVLLRAHVPNFSTWGMEMLITQLYDTSRPVAMAALGIIEEACENEAHLFSIIKMRPSLLHLGDRGAMMVCRFMSVPAGFKFLSDANYVANELQRWYKTFNEKYVTIVEEQLNEALMTYERTYDGSYTRRSSKKRPRKDVYVPFHLYGQLVQHKEGLGLLKKQEYMSEYFECVRVQQLNSRPECIKLKTALWALGHLGTSMWGIAWLEEEGVIPVIIKLAEESAVFSIRGTAFYVLGLVSSTRRGCTVLAQYGWESVWHVRSENWPLLEDHSIPSREGDEMFASMDSERNDRVSTITVETEKVGCSESVNLHDIDNDKMLDQDCVCRDFELIQNADDELNGISACGTTAIPRTVSEYIRAKSVEDSCSSSLTLASQSDVASTNSFISNPSPDVVGSPRRKSIAERNAELRSKFLRDYPSDLQLLGSQPALSHNAISTSGKYPPGNKKRAISESDTTNASQNLFLKNAGSASRKLYTSETCVSDVFEDRTFVDGDFIPPSLVTSCEYDCVDLNARDIDVKQSIQLDHDSTESLAKRKIMTDLCEQEEDWSREVFPENNIRENSESVENVPDKHNISTAHNNHVVGIVPSIVENGDVVFPKEKSALINDFSVNNVDQLRQAQTSHDLPAAKLNRNDQKKSLTINIHKYFDNVDSVDEKSTYVRSLSDHGETLKPRSNSFNTCTATGVTSKSSRSGSFHSIGAAMSLKNPQTPDSEFMSNDRSLAIHPSSSKRRLANLTRVPSLHRRTHSRTMSPQLDNSSLMTTSFRTSRSEWGHMTLRNIKQHASRSYMDRDSVSPTDSTHSYTVDSIRSGGSLSSCPLPFVSSFSSDDPDLHTPELISQGLHRHLLQRVHKADTGEAEFVGISLPVDVTMMFEVNEGEDRRTNSIPITPSTHDVWHRDTDIPPRHNFEHCLACCREKLSTVPIDQTNIQISVTEVIVCEEEMQNECWGGFDPNRLRAESANTDTLSSSSGSHTDTAGAQKMNEDNAIGRMLIRKEMMRFMTNLASSIGTRSSEQGLLYLKQKFPTFFRDVCVYSDISHLLATYSFRLNARRFIQELFDELNIQKLFIEPGAILNLEIETTTKMATITPKEIDEFSDVFT